VKNYFINNEKRRSDDNAREYRNLPKVKNYFEKIVAAWAVA
jgi:hypothetical protein